MNPFLLLVIACTPLFSQHILYNESRDKTAKDALDAVKKITASGLTNSQLTNLEKIERDLLASEVAWTEASMRASLQGFRNWEGVETIVDTVSFLIELDESTVTKEEAEKRLKAQREEVDNALKRLRAEAKASAAHPVDQPLADEILNRISQADELLSLADRAMKGIDPKRFATASKALDQIQSGLDEVTALVSTVGKILRTQKEVSVDPRSLAPSPIRLQIQLLAIEAEYLKTLTAMRALRELDRQAVKELLAGYRSSRMRIQADGAELVETTIGKSMAAADPKSAVENVLDTLVQAAAIAAQQDSSERMWGTREAIEYARFQIRRNAVYNGSYESTLQAATQRLAAYYSSGLKPSQIARLIYELSTAFALPYLAVTR